MNATSREVLPQRGEFAAFLCDDGGVVAPDLVYSLKSVMLLAGADPRLWRRTPCAVALPAINSTRTRRVSFHRAELGNCATRDLWCAHDRALRCPPVDNKDGHDLATLLDVKIELAWRIMANCHMCSAACGVDRTRGQRGLCRLSAELSVGDYAGLYNEGPLVGAPTFAVFLGGCSLRCRFCYRPDDIDGSRHGVGGADLSKLLNAARTAGAQSWHFLGGNPDHSVHGILVGLRDVHVPLPVVWNSALVLAPDALKLLRGVVDIWLADYKFGNDRCAWDIARFRGYSSVIQENMAALSSESNVIVRHMKMAGHENCCTALVRKQVQDNYPRFQLLEHDCIDSRGLRSGSGAPTIG